MLYTIGTMPSSGLDEYVYQTLNDQCLHNVTSKSFSAANTPCPHEAPITALSIIIPYASRLRSQLSRASNLFIINSRIIRTLKPIPEAEIAAWLESFREAGASVG